MLWRAAGRGQHRELALHWCRGDTAAGDIPKRAELNGVSESRRAGVTTGVPDPPPPGATLQAAPLHPILSFHTAASHACTEDTEAPGG